MVHYRVVPRYVPVRPKSTSTIQLLTYVLLVRSLAGTDTNLMSATVIGRGARGLKYMNRQVEPCSLLAESYCRYCRGRHLVRVCVEGITGVARQSDPQKCSPSA